MGRGGGQVVSVLAINSDDPCSNPAEAYSFSVTLCLKRTKINKKEARILKKNITRLFSTNSFQTRIRLLVSASLARILLVGSLTNYGS